MKNNILFLLILLTSMPVIAQLSYEERIELELKDGYANEKLIEFGNDGFVMISENEKSTGGESEWKYELFNTKLESVNTKNVLLSKKYRFDEMYSHKDRIHTLYKDRRGNFTIVSVMASTLEVTQVDGIIPKKSWIKEMIIHGDYAFFNASIKKAPYLFSVNWKTGEKKLIQVNIGDYGSSKISVTGFQVLEESSEIFLYARVQVKKKESDMYIIRLNDQGEKKETFKLSQNIDKNIIDISASKIGEEEYIYTGTYSAKTTNKSEGLLFCSTHKNTISFIQFYNFLDLENFLSYLPERKQEKIERKKDRKEDRGKEYAINYYIAEHDVISLDDGYLLLAEAYYPTTRTYTYTTTSTMNGATTTTTHTVQVFDGYQYTHAVLAKFNKEGQLLWDDTFEMWSDYKPFKEEKFISLSEFNKETIKLVFANRNKIVSRSVDYNGKVIQDSESEEIETPYEGDKSKKSYFSYADYWYDNYFIAYGTQKIKNTKDKDVERKRIVYFISKVKYE